MNICHLSYYIPDNTVSIEQVINCYAKSELPPDFEDKEELAFFFQRFVGLKEVHIDESLDEIQLIDKSFEKIGKNRSMLLSDIKLIVDFSCAPFFNFRNCGHFIKYKYKLDNANVVNISGNLCANLDIALNYCSQLYNSKSRCKILFCGGTKIPQNRRLAGSFSIMGDSFGIIIADFAGNNFKLLDSEVLTAGELYCEQESENQSFIISRMHIDCLINLFARNNKQQIKKIFIPNGFPVLIVQNLKKIGFEEDIIYTNNISKGHFAYLDTLINIKDFTLDNPSFNGKILTISVSYSGTIVASIYNINENN